MEENNTPVEQTVEQTGQVPVTPEVQPEENGQGAGEGTPEPVPTFEERLTAFATKKGWKPEVASEQLLKSYEELEGHLGDYTDVKSKAQQYDQLYSQSQEWYKKSLAWDQAQEALKTQEQTSQIENGTLDLEQLPIADLSTLWRSGKVGMAEIPPNRQWEVQQYAIAQEKAVDDAAATRYNQLVEQYPILKDPKVEDMVAVRVQRGMNEIEAIKEVEGLLQDYEKKGEERIRADMEKLKAGNLERTNSAAPTIPSAKTKSVRDAFAFAETSHGHN